MISIDSKPINITDFPDGTCKLTYSIVELIGHATSAPIDITWLYDNDSEIFQYWTERLLPAYYGDL